MRGKQAPRRKILPDHHYNSAMVQRMIHLVMERGKKTIATRIVYGALEKVKAKTKKEPLAIFEEAIKTISPNVEVKSRRIGGANYQIPIEVRGDRREALAMRWILTAARAKHGRPMEERLADELLEAIAKQGDAWKKREDVRRMAEANRAFAHFA